MTENSSDTDGLLERLRHGDQQALANLFSRHRERLWNMVSFRLDRRLLGRVDADDVLQEAYIDATERIVHYINEHSGSFYIWLRMIVSQALVNIHRRHLGAQMRDAKRDVSIFPGHHHQAASTSLALQLLGQLTSPSQVAMREETARRLQEAVDGMDDLDREVLTLRHFEQLTNGEVAEALEIKPKAASIRYIRALRRLKDKLGDLPEFSD